MADVGIVFSEIAIGATKYGDLMELALPNSMGQRLVHIVPNSTSFPVKELGYLPGTLSGLHKITATSVDEFVVAVRTGSAERKISFMIGAVEYYVYSYSGDITDITCFNPGGPATRLYLVGWSFPLSRSRVYVGSSDAVLWGSL